MDALDPHAVTAYELVRDSVLVGEPGEEREVQLVVIRAWCEGCGAQMSGYLGARVLAAYPEIANMLIRSLTIGLDHRKINTEENP